MFLLGVPIGSSMRTNDVSLWLFDCPNRDCPFLYSLICHWEIVLLNIFDEMIHELHFHLYTIDSQLINDYAANDVTRLSSKWLYTPALNAAFVKHSCSVFQPFAKSIRMKQSASWRNDSISDILVMCIVILNAIQPFRSTET